MARRGASAAGRDTAAGDLRIPPYDERDADDDLTLQGGRLKLMRLSWNEVRARAAAFAEDWKNAAYEKGETQSFYNAFFEVFGVQRRNVAC